MHKAVLRFRSEAVSQLTGIEFKAVTVRKGIWASGKFSAPSIRLANLYALKVLGEVASDRSIWNIAEATRYIAPETLYEQLVEAAGPRIRWGEPCDYGGGGPIISTAPLPMLMSKFGYKIGDEFQRQSIRVERYRVPKCEAYQTVYFPEHDTPVYRASITGDLLIVESTTVVPHGSSPMLGFAHVLNAFGIEHADFVDSGDQKFGKIIPLSAGVRRSLLHRLTTEHGVFSVGRYATWRNILLDDVVQDIAVIRRLLRASKYEQLLFASS